MIRVMLDTNICIELIRGKRDQVLRRLRRRKAHTVGISSITLSELWYGVEKSQCPEHNTLALLQFCAPLIVLDFDDTAAACYGKLRAELEAKGHPVGPMDMLIGAHALSLNTILVTNNEREFRRIQGLKVENWVKG